MEGGGILSEAFIRYTGPDGEPWRVEAGEKLLSDFGIPIGAAKDGLAKWHGAFECQQGFDLLCRLYAVFPVMSVGEMDPELTRPLGLQGVASDQGWALRQAEEFLENCKEFWRQWNAEKTRGKSKAAPAAAPVQPEETRLDEKTIGRLLKDNGFGGVSDPEEREFIAGRIMELELYIDNDQTKMLTRSLIQQEVLMFFVTDRAIAATRNSIAEAKDEVKIAKLGDSLQKFSKERREQQTSINQTMEKLGMDEAKNSTIKKKVGAQSVITMLMDGMAKYYSDQDNELLDGIYTAHEIVLLTTPLSLRPQQYRPDIVISAIEAVQNLWNRDYEPSPMKRIALRRLRAGFEEGLSRVRSELGETIADMGESGQEDSVIESAQSVAVPMGMQASAGAGAGGMGAMGNPLMEAAMRAAHGSEDAGGFAAV